MESFRHSHLLRRRHAANRRAKMIRMQRRHRHKSQLEGSLDLPVENITHDGNHHIPENDQHLLFPEALSPEIDAQLKKEVQDEQRAEFVYKVHMVL